MHARQPNHRDSLTVDLSGRATRSEIIVRNEPAMLQAQESIITAAGSPRGLPKLGKKANH